MGEHTVSILCVGCEGPGLQTLRGAAAAAGGVRVAHASGVAEAREVADEVAADLILALLEFPDGDAAGLVEAFPEVPVILLTGDPDAAACRRALEAGAFDWMEPEALDAPGLRQTVARALRVRELLRARIRAERALRQKEQVVDQVTRNGGVGAALVTRDFQILWANEQAVDLFGPVVGRPCHQAFRRGDEVCPACGVRQVFETGQARVVLEPEEIDVRGNRAWFEVIAVPLVDEARVDAALELWVPITDRKRTEEALRESETRYRRLSLEFNAVLDAIPDNLTLQSPELRILWANRGAVENLGREAGDLIGRHCYEVWQCRSEPCESCPVRRCFATGVATMECVVTPDQRAWELRAVPIRRDDGPVSAVVEVGREITAHRRTELERERLIRRLESKNAELEDFTHTVSHDLKSPLTTIRGFTSLLLRELDEGRVERVRGYGAKIALAGERMQQLLDELLELSLAGRPTGGFEPVPLGEVVEEALSNLAVATSRPEVRVSVSAELPVVRGDRVRLREVIENLVGNAVKFLGRQPRPRVEIGLRPGPTGPIFFVRDNGIGLDAEDRHRIFGLFRKLDPDTEGTGVGLAIVKRIVEVHGGAIWVESGGPGTGSTFCFTLGPADVSGGAEGGA